jgi:hypothetical protein
MELFSSKKNNFQFALTHLKQKKIQTKYSEINGAITAQIFPARRQKLL